ncbi:hypothetical protein AAFM48_28650 [Burkholderia pseudomallei]
MRASATLTIVTSSCVITKPALTVDTIRTSAARERVGWGRCVSMHAS